jgi:hypothetical protein
MTFEEDDSSHRFYFEIGMAPSLLKAKVATSDDMCSVVNCDDRNEYFPS